MPSMAAPPPPTSTSPAPGPPPDPHPRARARRRRAAAGDQPHICIIGAGMTGLRCAEALLQRGGVRVTILEGRDRIGGRIAQQHAGPHLCDMGPNWIHGTVNNPIVALAHETNTALHAWPHAHQTIIDAHGRPLDARTAAACSAAMWRIVHQAYAHSRRHAATIPAHLSLRDFFRSTLDAMPDAEVLAEAEAEADVDADVNVDAGVAARRRQLILHTAEIWGAIVGASLAQQSLKFFWLEEGIEGENLFVASTYQAILARVARRPLAQADVRLRATVTAVRWDPGRDQVALRTADGGGGGGGGAERGCCCFFDEVVVTAPLGWLKRHHQAVFWPPLPPRLARAIDAVAYGQLEKVYVTFPRAYWDGNGDGNGDAPPPQEPPTTSSFFHFLHPSYAPATNPRRWPQECVNLGALPLRAAGLPPHPTLLFYTFAPASGQLVARLAPHAPGSAAHDAILRAAFEPYYARLPHYDPADPDCWPRAFLATAWSADELAGCGSYSYFERRGEEVEAAGTGTGAGPGAGPADEQQLDRDLEVMRRGLPERRTWFAGEHTAPFIASGTVSGAWLAGDAVARRIWEGYFGEGEGEGEGEGVERDGDDEGDADAAEAAEAAGIKGTGEPKGLDR
ncbi:MAG: hypothetical protein M1826_004331 [Phylliscum demangeonii]|nr:MAG: hypothetical protein M1826_004331 [Phylliscum demangeonii]